MNRADELPASINDKSVFLGDSITYFWSLPRHNAGIPGQNTAQIEARFQTAVVQSGLSQVILLTGANDVRGASPDYHGIMANIQKMVAQGRAAGINVILCELTPITCCDTQVRTLNAMIKNYAATQNLILVDYYTPMAGKDSTYLADGLHPNPWATPSWNTPWRRLFNRLAKAYDRVAALNFPLAASVDCIDFFRCRHSEAQAKNPRISLLRHGELRRPGKKIRGFFPLATLKGQNDGLRGCS